MVNGRYYTCLFNGAIGAIMVQFTIRNMNQHLLCQMILKLPSLLVFYFVVRAFLFLGFLLIINFIILSPIQDSFFFFTTEWQIG